MMSAVRRWHCVSRPSRKARTATRVNPSLSGINLALANNYLLQRRPDDAITRANEVIKADPKVADAKAAIAHRIIGAANLERGRVDAALVEFQKATALDPKNSLVQLGLDEVYQKKGWADQARGAYRKAINLSPKDPRAYNNLAFLTRLPEASQARDALGSL
jgi:Tfp pilus assembly protein PilF